MSGKISRKRGRGRGRARGILRGRGFGLAFVRGGAHPGEEQEEFDDISSFKQFSMNTADSSLEQLLFNTEGDEYFGNVGHEVIRALFFSSLNEIYCQVISRESAWDVVVATEHDTIVL